ncbi:hypothetical protein GT354_26170, partial [Streptomyces sp. SID3343]|nr:hypothetical protein [Streptomyces sp. SID3343]
MPRTDFASAWSEEEIGRLADAALAELTRRLATRVFAPTEETGDDDALGRPRSPS